MKHIFTDTKFILSVKRDLVENKIYEKIEKEIKKLDDIEKNRLNMNLKI